MDVLGEAWRRARRHFKQRPVLSVRGLLTIVFLVPLAMANPVTPKASMASAPPAAEQPGQVPSQNTIPPDGAISTESWARVPETIGEPKLEVFSCEDVSEIPEPECEALVALYNSTDGANWAVNTKWLSSTTPSNWWGVTVSGGHVTHVWLDGNQLTGTIPSELGDLESLELLSFYCNQLTGAIPAELGNLTNLELLFLIDNQLTGIIPPELGNLTNLTDLDLSYNQLTGTIPSELGDLENLTGLGLSYNQLSGDIPRCLTELDLGSLYLGYNMLTASDEDLRVFLDELDEGWADVQTVPPTALQATAVTSRTIELSWTPITYTAHSGYYQVSYAIASGGPYTVHCVTADKSSTGYVMDNLSPGTVYYVVVRTYTPAHDGQQNDLWSSYTAEIAASTSDEEIEGLAAINDGPTPLGSVTTLSASVSAGTNVTYTWALGDGEIDSGAVVTHTYSSCGSYNAVVTGTNCLTVVTATTTVTIPCLLHLPLVLKDR